MTSIDPAENSTAVTEAVLAAWVLPVGIGGGVVGLLVLVVVIGFIVYCFCYKKPKETVLPVTQPVAAVAKDGPKNELKVSLLFLSENLSV